MSERVIETVIGAAVLAVALGFLAYFAVSVDIGARSGGYQARAAFDRVDGLKTGSDVRMAGIKIGRVIDLSLDPRTLEAVVVFDLDASIPVPVDSNAAIRSDGLLGPSYVSIEPGGEEDVLGHGDVIRYTQGSVDLLSLASRYLFRTDAPAPEAER